MDTKPHDKHQGGAGCDADLITPATTAAPVAKTTGTSANHPIYTCPMHPEVRQDQVYRWHRSQCRAPPTTRKKRM